MRRVALLDVNVLVALFDPDHVHHDLAHDWFAENRRDGWATCPLTENGCLRVLSNPVYRTPPESASSLIARLKTFCDSRQHQFWPDDVSLRDASLFTLPLPSGHRQLTDVYLLGLAKKKGGCLVTFDRTIPRGAVSGARPDLLQVISADE